MTLFVLSWEPVNRTSWVYRERRDREWTRISAHRLTSHRPCHPVYVFSFSNSSFSSVLKYQSTLAVILLPNCHSSSSYFHSFWIVREGKSRYNRQLDSRIRRLLGHVWHQLARISVKAQFHHFKIKYTKASQLRISFQDNSCHHYHHHHQVREIVIKLSGNRFLSKSNKVSAVVVTLMFGFLVEFDSFFS